MIQPTQELDEPVAGELRFLAQIPMVGREQEVDRAQVSLAHRRWLTLTGPPGIGKSRFAAEMALRAHKTHAPVLWIDLASATMVSVRRLVLETLRGQRHNSPSELEEAVQALNSQENPFVVFDHPEKVIDELNSLLIELRKRTTARFLVVTRTRLGSLDENVFRVEPLSTGASDVLLRQQIERLGARPQTSEEFDALVRHTEGNPHVTMLVAYAFSMVGSSAALDFLGQVSATDSMSVAIASSLRELSESVRRVLIAASTFPDPFVLADLNELVGQSSVLPLEELIRNSLLRQAGDAHFAVFSTVSSVLSREYPEDYARSVGELKDMILRSAVRGDDEVTRPYLRRIRAMRTRLEHVADDAERLADGAAATAALIPLMRLAEDAGGVREIHQRTMRWIPRDHPCSGEFLWLAGELAGSVLDAKALDRILLRMPERFASDDPFFCSLLALKFWLSGDVSAWAKVALKGLSRVESINDVHARADIVERLALHGASATYLSGELETSRNLTTVALSAASSTGSETRGVAARLRHAQTLCGIGDDAGAQLHATEGLKLAREADAKPWLAYALRCRLLFQALAADRPDMSLWSEMCAISDSADTTATARMAVSSVIVLGSTGRYRDLNSMLKLASIEVCRSSIGTAMEWNVLALGHAMIGDFSSSRTCLEEACMRTPKGESFPARHAAALAEFTTSVLDGIAAGDAGRMDDNSAILAPFQEHFSTRLVLFAAARLKRAYGRAVLRIDSNCNHFSLGATRVDISAKPILKTLLLALARAHDSNPERGLRYEELVALLWQESRVSAALRSRVRASVTNLRGLGLAGVEYQDGYRLEPGMLVIWE